MTTPTPNMKPLKDNRVKKTEGVKNLKQPKPLPKWKIEQELATIKSYLIMGKDLLHPHFISGLPKWWFDHEW